jgi:hypothetical protein
VRTSKLRTIIEGCCLLTEEDAGVVRPDFRRRPPRSSPDATAAAESAKDPEIRTRQASPAPPAATPPPSLC